MAKKTRNAIDILERLTGDDPELHEMIAEETVNAQVARIVYEARAAARGPLRAEPRGVSRSED